jgi:hypothetical protein
VSGSNRGLLPPAKEEEEDEETRLHGQICSCMMIATILYKDFNNPNE